MAYIEGEQSEKRIVPVFGQHEINTKDLFQFRELIDQQGALPQNWIWSDRTISRVKGLNPRLLAIDGLIADTQTNRAIFFSPGSPVNLQPCTFVGADVPVAQFMGSRARKESIVDAGIRQYWMDLTGGSAVDPNQEYVSNRIGTFIKQATPELLLLFLLSFAAQRLTGDSSDALQQLIIYGGGARLIFARSIIRRIAPFVDYKTLITLSRLTSPLLMKTGDLEVRNAVTAVKLMESEGPSVALYGTNHANGSNLWNNPKKQYQVVQTAVEKAAEAIGKKASQKGVKIPRSFNRDVETGLNDFFSKVAYWRFDRVPADAETIRAINKRIVKESSLNPTISGIVREIVKNL